MQTLSKIVPDYVGKVDFYLVAFNEDTATLERYVADRQYTNMASAQPAGSLLRDLKIVSQSSMLALDADGVITFRKGYGRGGSAEQLRAEFGRLAP